MRAWRNSLLILLSAAFCLAQTGSEMVTPEIRRVGEKLACLCKSCTNTVGNCPMLQCHYTHPAREKIAAMQAQGMSDQQIIDSFVKERGLQTLAVPPAEGFNTLAWVTPFIAITFGIFAIWLWIRRNRKPVPPGVAVPADQLSRYQEEIEKDLAKLD